MNKPTQFVLVGAGVALALAGGMVACSGPGGPGSLDTATTGRVAVSVDETFGPILQAQLDTFSQLYPLAHVRMAFQPEEKVMQALMNDSVKVAVVPRELTAAELTDAFVRASAG